MSTHEQGLDTSHDDDAHLHFASHLTHDRPHSIDMSLELERQLDNEAFSPSSPTQIKDRPVSLDPHVLSAIVANLRQALLEMTRERDELVEGAAESHAREAELKEALAIVSERCTGLETEVDELKRKSQGDDDAIAMLRTKVEESRRGLMRLQTESRRMSQITNLNLETSRPPSSFFSPPSSSKRASFTPLTGSAPTRIHSHRRISSVSDSAAVYSDNGGDAVPLSTSPGSLVLAFPDEMRAGGSPNPNASRRISGLFSRNTSSPPPDLSNQLAAHVEALKREVASLRTELDDARNEVSEAYEAREASELCVSALRNFIADNAVGEVRQGSAAQLPPMPSNNKPQEAEPRKSGGWTSLKLWRVDTKEATTNRSTGSGPDAVTSPGSDTSPQTAVPQTVPLSKKIGDFFSSRASVSSASSQNTPHYLAQEPMLNGSDCSSVDEPEPVSPEAGQSHGSIVVRDITNGRGSSEVKTAFVPVDTKDAVDEQAADEYTGIAS